MVGVVVSEKRLITMPEFAKIIGVTSDRVRVVVRQGKLDYEQVGHLRKVDPEKAKKQWAANVKKGTHPSGKTKETKETKETKVKVVYKDIEVPMFQGMTTADAERKKKVFDAKLSELKFLEQSGELIRKDEIQRAAFESGRKVRDSVMSVPARFTHELAAEVDPHKLEVQLNNILVKALEQGMRGSYEKEKNKNKK